ncbi:UDP-2,3-diacylglucosamine diphosphatase [Ideonella sp.]|uniref:UDP-2,3-diacylglucosamine diphosphatase n=1 Tax=Ideonella sp. TaxID=1929293 RepID=UPI0035AE2398
MDFISDLHLAPELPRTVAAWRAYLVRTHADAVVILGDLFEVWVGDDAATLPFEAACVSALADASRRRPVYVMRGNRDFLLGAAFFAATAATDLPDPVVLHAPGCGDSPVLLSHGDAWCLADEPYQRFRAQVRTPAWQAAFLSRPLPERLALAAQMRAASREHQHGHGPSAYADVDTATALAWLGAVKARTLIHGHTHRPGTEALADGTVRHVLSDWDADGPGAARGEVLRWSAGGFRRLLPEQA